MSDTESLAEFGAFITGYGVCAKRGREMLREELMDADKDGEFFCQRGGDCDDAAKARDSSKA